MQFCTADDNALAELFDKMSKCTSFVNNLEYFTVNAISREGYLEDNNIDNMANIKFNTYEEENVNDGTCSICSHENKASIKQIKQYEECKVVFNLGRYNKVINFGNNGLISMANLINKCRCLISIEFSCFNGLI